jgi:hypothetical protein
MKNLNFFMLLFLCKETKELGDKTKALWTSDMTTSIKASIPWCISIKQMSTATTTSTKSKCEWSTQHEHA